MAASSSTSKLGPNTQINQANLQINDNQNSFAKGLTRVKQFCRYVVNGLGSEKSVCIGNGVAQPMNLSFSS